MGAGGPQVEVLCLSHSPQMAGDVEHRQGLPFRAGFAQVRAAVRDYDPTLLVYFGPDHLRALVGIAPCFTLVESATGYGDWGTPVEDYAVPTRQVLALGEHLVDDGLDIAMAPALRLDHGFGQSTFDLFDSLSAVPMLPVVINCIDRPLATLARTAELGASIGRFVRAQVDPGERVLVIGSGGLSHAPPSLVPEARGLDEQARQALISSNLAVAAESINPDWDARFLRLLADPAWHEAGAMTPADLAGGGAGGAEVRTWVAALFAGGAPLQSVVYEPVPEWITGMGIAASPRISALAG